MSDKFPHFTADSDVILAPNMPTHMFPAGREEEEGQKKVIQASNRLLFNIKV